MVVVWKWLNESTLVNYNVYDFITFGRENANFFARNFW